MTTKDKGYPGTVPEDAYDDNYPDGVAGHVASGARVDTASDIVTTPFGVDHEFSGAELTEGHPPEPRHAGADETARLINKTVTAAREADKPRRPVTDVADHCRMGNVSLLALDKAERLLLANRNRKAATISCVSGGPVWVSMNGNITTGAGAAPSPNAVSLPTSGFRTFTHRADIWVVGPAGAVVDFVEENYDA